MHSGRAAPEVKWVVSNQPDQEMNTILAPIDFSPVSQAVIEEAMRLARQIKGRIVLLHVVQPPVITSYDGVAFADVAAYTTWAAKNTDQHFARLRLKLKAARIPTLTIREIGFPPDLILAEAKKRGVEYIMIGSHGHTAFYDLLVGSTTSSVLKRTTCPVIVVPAKKRAARKKKR